MHIDKSCLNGKYPLAQRLKRQFRAKLIEALLKPYASFFLSLFKNLAIKANSRSTIIAYCSKQTAGKKKDPFFDGYNEAGIYVITCVPEQKYYVGTSEHVRRRINAHRSAFKRGVHDNRGLQHDFNKYFNKYGLEQFTFQKLIIGTGLGLQKREALEVSILETLPREKRYNVQINHRDRSGQLNRFYGHTMTESARQEIREQKIGKPSSFKGHTQSDEVKQKISELNCGRSSDERKKGVYINDIFYPRVALISFRSRKGYWLQS